MPALVAGTHVLLGVQAKTWMAGTSPAMTSEFVSPSRLQAHHLILATCPVRVLQIYAPNIEGAGKAGCRADTHSPVCKIKSTRVSRHRCAGTSGFPCAMVLTVSFVLSLVIGLCCHHTPRNAKHCRENASVEASGPHDFAVRYLRRSSCAAKASTASRPTFVTMANAPLIEAGRAKP